MKRPTIHLICNAHLDPVWQWRWEEGCSEAIATFGNAVDILHEHPGLIFNHNESVLYEWVRHYDPPLFKEIQRLVRKGRWHIGGGWYLQPDVNLPGPEAIIRHITRGRRFFLEHFNTRPTVAYNFDSFGHSAGLPQILRRAGYRMYIHMRPQESEMHLPADLYRWRGVDGSEILTYRIAVGLYHTERDNIEQRLQEGKDLALKINRDVPVFWGIGNHGGGPTREDLAKIESFVKTEETVNVRHSTPEMLYDALRKAGHKAPVVEGELQRVFTGCYTSLSRLKRGAILSLGTVLQTETLRTATWWQLGQEYPAREIEEGWGKHLFNDFHDILPGSCTEPAEQDALNQYGLVDNAMRVLRLGAATAMNEGKSQRLYVPVTVMNTNPACTSVPIEAECMLDLRPKWTGTWHLRLYTLDGQEIPCQEEQPESLLPFNGWRRKVSFFPQLPSVGASHYEIRILGGTREPETSPPPALNHNIDSSSGLVTSLDAGEKRECLAGSLLRALVVDDDGDAWGADRWSYRNVLGQFETIPGSALVLQHGAIRTITEATFAWGKSTIVMRTYSYPEWPVLEFRLRVQWNENRKRLKLSIPTAFQSEQVACEVLGGAMPRPADGQEYVHGRWAFLSGPIAGRPTGFGIVNSGQHGFDFKDGEIRLSVLRGAAYCHEQGFTIGEHPSRKYMDQGVHDVKLLITAGDPDLVHRALPGLADWLSAPPAVYAHLPIGTGVKENAKRAAENKRFSFLSLEPSTVRLMACMPSVDGKRMLVRLQETLGKRTKAALIFGQSPRTVALKFEPFEIKTLRIKRGGGWKEVEMIEMQ
jgi:alpha-mannosidase